MSYVRFGEADVYVYTDVRGHLACCGCLLGDKWEFRSTDEILAHLREHRAVGHHVPDRVFEDLARDCQENDEFIAETAAVTAIEPADA